MIGNGADAWGDLVNTVIHESAHATFYVKNQSYFNESLAQFIGDELTPVFLKKFLPHEIEPYLKEERNSEERATQFQKGYLKLSEIYRSSESSEIKLKRKQEVLEQMKAALGIKREINNATLIQYRTYGIGKNDFLQLLSRCEGDWKKFFGVISSISAASFAVDHSEDFSEVLKLK
jgi:predicted aminopeptidase